MGLARTAIFDGPGSLLLGTQALYAKDNIVSTPNVAPWRPMISTHGQGKPRRADGLASTVFTPGGIIDAGTIAALFPAWCLTVAPNTSIFGAADVACKIHGLDGNWVQFTSSAIEQPPELILDPRETAFGQCTIGHVIGSGLDRADAGSLFTTGTTTYDGAVDDADIIAVPYVALLDDVPLYTDGAWRITCEVDLSPRYINSIGTVDKKVGGVIWRARATLANLDYADLLGYVGIEEHALGSVCEAGEDFDLTITGAAGGIAVTLYGVSIVEGPAQWGATELRSGEVGFESHGMGTIAAIAIATEPEPEA